MSGPGVLRVEVVYAEPVRQWVLSLEVPAGSTVGEVIDASGVREQVPGLTIDPARVGIFGRRVSLDDAVAEGDRVELYRPLLADPKEVRRERARQQSSG